MKVIVEVPDSLVTTAKRAELNFSALLQKAIYRALSEKGLRDKTKGLAAVGRRELEKRGE